MKRIFLAPFPIAASLLVVVGLFAFVPNSAASDFFLHSSTTDFLDSTSPTATTAKFKDSPAVNRTTYREIGTWSAAPAATWMRLSSLTDLHVWIGLKNSDDQGTYFDLRAELRKNGVVIASGETKTIQGVTRNPANAKEVTVAFGAISDNQFNPGDVLSIRILTKVADSGGHSNAVGLRLYYDAVSRPSSFGAVFVVDTTPPTIASAVNPAPNAAGWHKSDATVSFTCSDSESGVASCPVPITVSTEGGNQVVSGTAIDRAGNTASTSVTLNIDKTPPTLSPTITPQPNLAGWNRTDVTAGFTCSDATSGIAVCPSPVTVSTESANQLISGTATDLAGNTAFASVLISLDKTAPTVAITSPSNGATVSSSPVNVTGTASDSLSGLATVLCNGSPAPLSTSTFSCDVPLTNGPNTITVEATDVAGNLGSSSITVTLGQPPEPQNFPSAINAQGDLFGENWGDQIVFNWGEIEDAAGYIVYRSESITGPWAEILRITDNTSTSSKVDITPDAQLNDLCYKVEAIDTNGIVIRIYEPICVPKFVDKQKQSFFVREQSAISGQVEKIGDTAMRKVLTLAISYLLLTVHFSYTGESPPRPTSLDPEQILKSLVREIPDIKMVTAKDLEPNPQGEYRRHAFIQGDFNRDGQEDIAIAATDDWVRQGISLTRNAYVLVASKKKNETWTRVFFHKFRGLSSPFLIWDKERMALLVGANFSDSNPGDIVWDRAKKEYKLLQVIEK